LTGRTDCSSGHTDRICAGFNSQTQKKCSTHVGGQTKYKK
jgi:hypothetical protein